MPQAALRTDFPIFFLSAMSTAFALSCLMAVQAVSGTNATEQDINSRAMGWNLKCTACKTMVKGIEGMASVAACVPACTALTNRSIACHVTCGAVVVGACNVGLDCPGLLCGQLGMCEGNGSKRIALRKSEDMEQTALASAMVAAVDFATIDMLDGRRRPIVAQARNDSDVNALSETSGKQMDQCSLCTALLGQFMGVVGKGNCTYVCTDNGGSAFICSFLCQAASKRGCSTLGSDCAKQVCEMVGMCEGGLWKKQKAALANTALAAISEEENN
eukprot:TRINITY_DN79073_c0_g1_i1.p1 TRINITY_DN79073_c0_g1~~TRINITY_DN79073_c0_g1_i1.p1  ORF type:complete len:274 (+),score=60.62 TRINITY_DN79073_c0_g1_i1:15-836(+)